MESSPKLTVNKPDGNIMLFLFGLFQIGGGIYILFILFNSLFKNVILNKDILLNFFLLFITIFLIPAGIFSLVYAFGDRKIFEINTIGIKIKDQTPIRWENIYEIETKKYPGPRMTFYRIRITQDIGTSKKRSIWITSDVKPNWTEIIDCLATYTVKYNINIG